MADIKKEIIDGKPLHYVVGFIVERDGKYLLMERNNFPYGFAGSAGHVDEGEEIHEALDRELKEELGLKATKSREVFRDKISLNPCRYDGTYDHMTFIYAVETSGDLKIDTAEVKRLDLEPMWGVVFDRIFD